MIHKNSLSYYPEELGALQNLEELNFYLNKIDSIPEVFFKYKKLKNLSWGVSKMSKLSGEIGELSELEYLTLVANQINQLPDSFCNFKNLKATT